RDLLLFSNPDTTKGRNHLTIKASLDGGDTWSAEHALLLDEEENWGYSCLSMIDSETVGILYEASTAQLLFQAVKLRDIVRGGTAPDIAFGALPEIGPADAGFAQGVSALCAGEVSGVLIAAGGANFAGTPAAEGGAKCFYDGIWMLRGLKEGKPAWREAGRLPEPMAYG
ncbi:sialidase, partial [human gut metagenome]